MNVLVVDKTVGSFDEWIIESQFYLARRVYPESIALSFFTLLI